MRILALAFVLACSSSDAQEHAKRDLLQQSTLDLAREYTFKLDHGAPKYDLCIAAGAVVQMLAKLGDAKRYQEWSTIRDHDCRAAGVQRP